MSKGKFVRKKQGSSWLYILPAAVVLILIFILLQACPKTKNPVTPSVATMPIVEKNPNSIAVPGYEMIELKADSKEQTLCFPNPPQNVCYFQITLCLEDGTQLWVSELIEPGTNSKPMVLAKALPKGTYPNAVLRYSCYRMDEDLSPLNGAETKVTLWVK